MARSVLELLKTEKVHNVEVLVRPEVGGLRLATTRFRRLRIGRGSRRAILTDAPTRRVTVCPRGTPVRNGTGASRNASHCSDASGRMGIQWQCHWKYGLSSDGIAITTSAIP